MIFAIALRNVFRHRTRSIITISAIAFGCTALIFVGGFFEDIFAKMRESYIKAHTGHLQIHRAGYTAHGSGKPFDYLIDNADVLVPIIRRQPGVAWVAQRLEFAALISTGDTTIACLAQGIEPQYELMVRPGQSTGRHDLPSLGGTVIFAGDPLDMAKPYTMILGKGLAGGIDADVDDALILVTHTVGGSINALDMSVRGLFFTSAKEFDDRVLRLPLATSQELLQTTGVQTLVVMLENTDATWDTARRFAELFRQREWPLEIRTWDEITDFYQKTRLLFGRMFFILKLVIGIVVILSIYNTMTMAVLERVSEIGTMMALGVKRRGVLTLFLCEGLTLGAIGGLAGIVAGSVVTLSVRWIGIPMPPPPGATFEWHSEPVVVPAVLLFAFGLSVITALVSSFHPAWKASRLEIAQALRHV